MAQVIPAVEHGRQRVLTTSQLAESYETDEKRISENFNRNQDRYQPGKHYYHLQGTELKSFLQSANCGIQNPEKVRSLYLWTEKGALLHAKSLNTDKAWEVYEHLVETYFRAKVMFLIPRTLPEALRLAADLAEKNALLAPKAESFDTFISKENLFTINEVAKRLAVPNMGEKNLFAYLRGRGILLSGESRWNQPKQRCVNSAYFVVRDGKPWFNSKGEEHIPKQTFVTPKGIDFIARMLRKDGFIKEKGEEAVLCQK